ncbi:STAS domain-containing protein [Seohaeicola saemankumensis]|uniref:Anti-sigma factor antagonist n=1 Tax=Seohaeicola saemankumensis TaxID=481181 RepID=A0ABW3TDD2_9RHOB
MRLTSQEQANWCVVTVEERRIDAAGAIAFKEAMRKLTEGLSGPVILDLGQVDFIDSSGLGAVVAAMKTLGGERRLHLAALTPNVDRVFSLTRMDLVFPIHVSVAAALFSDDR